MKFYFILVMTLFTVGCATPSASPTSPISKTITLSDIEKLRVGQTNISDATNQLGRPTQVVSKFSPAEIWLYQNSDGVQTASLTFDQQGFLVGAVWSATGAQDTLSVKDALTHFKNSSFTVKKEGWDKQGHSYSEDSHYKDEKTGITFTVNSQDQSVMSIGFGKPSSRVPAQL